jgi:hypothetical protein
MLRVLWYAHAPCSRGHSPPLHPHFHMGSQPLFLVDTCTQPAPDPSPPGVPSPRSVLPLWAQAAAQKKLERTEPQQHVGNNLDNNRTELQPHAEGCRAELAEEFDAKGTREDLVKGIARTTCMPLHLLIRFPVYGCFIITALSALLAKRDTDATLL